ncbi:anti-sigma factor [Oscillatoria sp. FACHB-1407]|uniref:anti-sigma factor n=1 Tax=Oscillatoria sp. FACHB-1407 TaxID=2692847 RepID=UPI001684713E|nr:anti-sigma factor [Oscillatoria sp. FACHB-1407]MBD2461120.1 anti-sigma factor [Oscillatoria sp. FACHB-1407]
MTHSALPDNWEELMADYVLGNLTPPEAEQFKQLIDTHPEVAAEVTQLQEVLHLIPYAIAQQPPAHLRDRLLSQAQAPNETSRLTRSRRSPVRWIGMVSTAAAVLVAVLLGADNYRLRQELADTRQVTQALKQPDTFIETLTGDDNAAGRVIVDSNQQHLVIVVQNLPALPPGQTYRLWAIADQTVNFWGQFETDANGTAIANLTIPAPQSNLSNIELRITVESVAAPPTPQGPVVLQSSL